MNKTRPKQVEAEPVGIVISSGDRAEPTPAFWAYIWGPAPVDLQAPAVKAA